MLDALVIIDGRWARVEYDEGSHTNLSYIQCQEFPRFTSNSLSQWTVEQRHWLHQGISPRGDNALLMLPPGPRVDQEAA